MEWSERYKIGEEPTLDEINSFVNNKLWLEIVSFMQDNYQSLPKITYSKCAAQSGWNVKFKRKGKSLCTLYPMPGYFIALVVIGNKETTETELLLPSLTEYTQKLFASTRFSCGGRWLMMHIDTPEVLEDLKKLAIVRASIK